MTIESTGPAIPSSFDRDVAVPLEGLQVQRLPKDGWLVRRIAADGSRPVIGCIDDLVDGVELMEMDGGFRWSKFASLDDALSHLATADHAGAFDPLAGIF